MGDVSRISATEIPGLSFTCFVMYCNHRDLQPTCCRYRWEAVPRLSWFYLFLVPECSCPSFLVLRSGTPWTVLDGICHCFQARTLGVSTDCQWHQGILMRCWHRTVSVWLSVSLNLYPRVWHSQLSLFCILFWPSVLPIYNMKEIDRKQIEFGQKHFLWAHSWDNTL